MPELFPKTNRKRVLLVEDDGRIVRFVRRGLIAEGYDVDVTDSGLEAVELVMECLYQAVILDVGLPDLDGMQVCDNLRACGVDTPILMLTAWNSVRDKVAGLRLGADDYMTKPFVFEELLARIDALARRRTGELRPEPKELRVADLVLNNETREVMRGKEVIDLTPKEFAMPECLLRTPGKALNRMRILEHVWGYSADPMTNVVDIYIHQLRRKIDEHHDKKLLKTVRGFGYKVDAS
ncbi:MAG: response regulator transcription factor [Proteobacteria bacterium]|nr:response regulator transcription factor [Pseudomonadota bacterium]